jgi:hypothetical protein
VNCYSHIRPAAGKPTTAKQTLGEKNFEFEIEHCAL